MWWGHIWACVSSDLPIPMQCPLFTLLGCQAAVAVMYVIVQLEKTVTGHKIACIKDSCGILFANTSNTQLHYKRPLEFWRVSIWSKNGISTYNTLGSDLCTVAPLRADFRTPRWHLAFSIWCFLNTIVFQRKNHFFGFCCNLKFKDSLANVHDSVWVFAPPHITQPCASTLVHQKYVGLTLPNLTLESVLYFRPALLFNCTVTNICSQSPNPQMLKISIAPLS